MASVPPVDAPIAISRGRLPSAGGATEGGRVGGGRAGRIEGTGVGARSPPDDGSVTFAYAVYARSSPLDGCLPRLDQYGLACAAARTVSLSITAES